MKTPLDPTLAPLADTSHATGPRAHINPPGQPQLDYRVGTYATFFETLRARLSAPEYPGPKLQTRDPSDPTLALLDAWACVGELNTFYQERWANEHYLRTATERASLLELARLVGHTLAPGVAASTHLVFTVDDSPQGVEEYPIAAGTRVQSIPGPGELPQTFETDHAIVARPEYNALKLRCTEPAAPPQASGEIEVEGQVNLNLGELLLSVATEKKLFEVAALDYDRPSLKTKLRLTDSTPATVPVVQFVWPTLAQGQFLWARTPFDGPSVDTQVFGKRWDTRLLKAVARTQHWPLLALRKVKPKPLPPTEDGLYRFNHRARLFGHNAPRYSLIPIDTVVPFPNTDWDSGYEINSDLWIDLDTTYSGVVAGSFAVFITATAQGTSLGWARIAQVKELSVAKFALSGKCTSILLSATDRGGTLANFQLRSTVVLVGSQPLPLAPVPLPLPAPDVFALEGRHLLEPGQVLAWEGERDDLPGIQQRELLTVKRAEAYGEITKVTLERPLDHRYRLASVRINANVARATHGETVTEVLGSGDGQKRFQSFQLKRSPLTYVPEASARGRRSTLQVRVNGITWHEVDTLHGQSSEARVFVTERDDQSHTTVRFGDGKTGARLPTGSENVVATYRVGIGAAGLVAADQLSLLLVRPLGVRAVKNFLAAQDAADPETKSEARRVVPTVALTLDRVVSLQDHADFAARIAGITKADARWLWDGTRQNIVVTVAGTQGSVPSDALCARVKAALQEAGDPHQALWVLPYRPGYFTVKGSVTIASDFKPDLVLLQVEARLRDRYGFSSVNIGAGISKSEVIALIHQTPGVIAVDLDVFDRIGGAALAPRLVADGPRAQPRQGAELLLLDPSPLEVTP